MKKLILFLFALVLIFTSKAYAIYDPTETLNNKFGIHILFPEEISEAATLVNSNGGDWGYVTIPIKSSDKDLDKWQLFMDSCKKYHIIPIVRLATDGDYFNKSSWSKPTDYDILDFANFLNSLSWPTKNRYVVIFNEENRSDEWGGSTNPSEYAQILNYAADIFKQKNKDFFIIMGGPDNASSNISGVSIDQYLFMDLVEQSVPGIYSKIDGIASHSYPNPGFSSPPTKNRIGIYSYYYQKQLADSYSGKNLPVFITETGWSSNTVSQNLQAKYYIDAFNNYWSDNNVVAVTPFVFNAQQGDFSQFSFLRDQKKTEIYQNYINFKKVKAEPELSEDFLNSKIFDTKFPTKDFNPKEGINSVFNTINNSSKEFFKWLLKV